jgi:hypothetical protein
MARDGRDGLNGRHGRDGLDGLPGKDGKDGRDADPALVESVVRGFFSQIPLPRDGKDAPIREPQSYRFEFQQGETGMTESILAIGSDGRDYLFEIERDGVKIHGVTATPAN